MEKNYIEITDESNNILKMEVVLTFNLENKDYNYIIYKDDKKCYLAKYKDNINDLITDFNDEELKLCNEIFKEVAKKWN